MNVNSQQRRSRPKGRYHFASVTDAEKQLPFWLVGVGCDFLQYPISREFGYPVYQWIQTSSGEGILKLDDQEYIVGENMGMMLLPHERHEYRPIGGDWYVDYIAFDGSYVGRLMEQLELKRSGVLEVKQPEKLYTHIRDALQNAVSNVPLKGFDASVIIYQLLIDIHKVSGVIAEETIDAQSQRLKPALDLLENQYNRNISVDELASITGVSTQHFCQMFKKVTGQTSTQYATSQRMERAKDLLFRFPNMQINEIAREIGYGNDSYFAVVFKKYVGVSPRQYRSLHF
jgi:AraC family transcriptional regulator of arabinose operon